MLANVSYAILLLFGCIRLVAVTCAGNMNCVSCVRDKTWSGDPCRWCPRDKKCHTKGSAVTHCSQAENIVDESHCNDVLSVYDPELSNKMLRLSSAAYDQTDPQRCLDNGLPESKFVLKALATAKCDLLGDQCSGYVAVSQTEKAIVVSFRGTTNKYQTLLACLKALTTPKVSFLDGQVERYWKNGYDLLWPSLEKEVLELRKQFLHYKIWVAGHSLGGAIASMVSYRLAYDKRAPRGDIILYTFGMPRVGNYDYALSHDKLVNNSWRVVNYHDGVPHFPSLIGLPTLYMNGPYHHGVEAFYKSPANNPNINYKECHGTPYNEDKSCSFTVVPTGYSIYDHKHYFGIQVGQFWRKGHCNSAYNSRRETVVSKFMYTNATCSMYKYDNVLKEYVYQAGHTRSAEWSPC